MGRLQNKVSLITGAGQGIGLATALKFAREGAIVVVAGITAAVLPGRRTPETIRALGDAFSNSIKAAVGPTR